MAATIPANFMDLFKKPALASLATLNADGSPQVTPVWCDFDGSHVIVNTARGRVKHRNLQREPRVGAGDDLGPIIAAAGARSGRPTRAGDVVVVAQKIVSKAEGALVSLDGIEPSALAARWAAAHGKDARVIEVVLRETRRLVR